MATFSYRKPVYPGLVEYTASRPVNAEDLIEIEFEDPVTIDDICLTVSEDVTVNIFFVFPASGLTAPVKTALSIDASVLSNWFLNRVSNSTAKYWYPLPARTKVRLEVGSVGEADTFLQWTLVGRSG